MDEMGSSDTTFTIFHYTASAQRIELIFSFPLIGSLDWLFGDWGWFPIYPPQEPAGQIQIQTSSHTRIQHQPKTIENPCHNHAGRQGKLHRPCLAFEQQQTNMQATNIKRISTKTKQNITRQRLNKHTKNKNGNKPSNTWRVSRPRSGSVILTIRIAVVVPM